jgi:hypothetical protein
MPEEEFKKIELELGSDELFEVKIIKLRNNQAISQHGFSLDLYESAINHKMILSFKGDDTVIRVYPKSNNSIKCLIKAFALDIVAMGYYGLTVESERLKKIKDGKARTNQ